MPRLHWQQSAAQRPRGDPCESESVRRGFTLSLSLANCARRLGRLGLTTRHPPPGPSAARTVTSRGRGHTTAPGGGGPPEPKPTDSLGWACGGPGGGNAPLCLIRLWRAIGTEAASAPKRHTHARARARAHTQWLAFSTQWHGEQSRGRDTDGPRPARAPPPKHRGHRAAALPRSPRTLPRPRRAITAIGWPDHRMDGTDHGMA